MSFLKVFFTLFLTFLFSTAFASKVPLTIKKYEDIQYNPVKYGLKRLSFDLNVSGIEDDLNKNFNIGKIRKITYKVNWSLKNSFTIKVMGLPSGFEKIKNDLKNLISERLDYIIPDSLSQQLTGYSFERKDNAGNIIITATDEKYQKSISKILLTFSRDGPIRSIQTYSPTGTQRSTFVVKKVTNGKYVPSEISARLNLGVNQTDIKTTLKYENVQGFFFPVKMTFKTTEKSMVNKKDMETREDERVITLSKIVVDKK